ncbi:MARVEL domain-containing protein 1 [Megalobrama amblycephala]|uniref:MARVEL domain-containing protein 1 n=1 Tax=Megalobrama amblycephala TaxID=75352 RepID=UPI0020147182|nr:MARVEL domain-containing protein 1 [Megalobrama amblycephala]
MTSSSGSSSEPPKEMRSLASAEGRSSGREHRTGDCSLGGEGEHCFKSCPLFRFSSSLLGKRGRETQLYSYDRKRKRQTDRSYFKTPGAERKIHSVCICRAILLQNSYQLLLTSPVGSFFPLFLCLWQTAPTLNTRRRSLQQKEEMPPQPQVKRSFLEFLKNFVRIVRVLQILLGAGLWVTIAANKYEGSIHYVLFVAVLFWLLTLAIFIITLLDKQDLVPIVGGERWLLSNVIHDIAATLLYLSAIGIMIYKTEKNSYCNLDLYKHQCLYKVYLTASVFACLTASVYLLSAIYGSCRKCRGERTVV